MVLIFELQSNIQIYMYRKMCVDEYWSQEENNIPLNYKIGQSLIQER